MMASDSRSMAQHLMSGSGVSKSAMSCSLDSRRCNVSENTNQTYKPNKSHRSYDDWGLTSGAAICVVMTCCSMKAGCQP